MNAHLDFVGAAVANIHEHNRMLSRALVAEGIAKELATELRQLKELFRFALLNTPADIARDGMVFVRRAEAAIAKAEERLP